MFWPKTTLVAILLISPLPAAFAKDAPTDKIQVVDTSSGERTVTYTTSGTSGTADTNCSTSIDDDRASTNCTTTNNPGLPPQQRTLHIRESYVHAIMPNGHHAKLECDVKWRWNHCAALFPQSYDASIDYIKGTVMIYYGEPSKQARARYRIIGSW